MNNLPGTWYTLIFNIVLTQAHYKSLLQKVQNIK